MNFQSHALGREGAFLVSRCLGLGVDGYWLVHRRIPLLRAPTLALMSGGISRNSNNHNSNNNTTHNDNSNYHHHHHV